MSSFLASNAGLTFSIILTVLVVIAFSVFIVILWWVDAKKRPVKELWRIIKKGIYNFFDKIFSAFTVNKSVKTVYSDKSMNYSGTEFLPIPTKAPTDKFTYEFVGWDKNAVDQNGNFVVRAVYLQKVIKCYVNVYDDDKTSLLKSFVVEYGAGVNLDDLTPSKPETKEFSYEFVGWDKDISAFYGNTNVCAIYKAIPKKYSYTFFEEDGKTVVSQGNALYGTPVIAPTAPQKETNGADVYEFVGWKNYTEGMLLTKDCTFVALYAKREIDDVGQSSIIKPDGTIIRGVKKLVQAEPVEKVTIVAKTEEKEEMIENNANDFLHGSVNSQISPVEQKAEEPVEEKPVQVEVVQKTEPVEVQKPHRVLDARTIIAQNQPDYAEGQDPEVHQHIELVSNKRAVKIDDNKNVQKTSNSNEQNVEDRVLQNLVVNRVKIKPTDKNGA